MGGLDREAARRAPDVSDNVDPVTVVALGWPGDPALLDEGHRAKNLAPHTRLPLVEIARWGGWDGCPGHYSSQRRSRLMSC